jgi:glycosyltransferase involved in cell wall biosynthesis
MVDDVETSSSIGVVVPVYNRAEKVIATLDSVAAQTRKPAKLVVVDDGSTDYTAESVLLWKSRRGGALNVQLIQQSNQGAGASRNSGLRTVEDFDFVAFLDSDDLWPSDFLERTEKALRENAQAVAVTCDRRIVTGPSEERSDTTEGLAADPLGWFFLNGAGIGSCSLFRVSAVKTCGGYDSRLPTGQDADLFLRVSLLGPWRHAPGAPVTFFRNMDRRPQEAPNLSLSLGNNVEQWAGIYQAIYALLREWPIDAEQARKLETLLAERWQKVGRHFRDSARAPERALASYLRALYWMPFAPNNWLRVAGSAFAAIGKNRYRLWVPPTLRPLPPRLQARRAPPASP